MTTPARALVLGGAALLHLACASSRPSEAPPANGAPPGVGGSAGGRPAPPPPSPAPVPGPVAPPADPTAPPPAPTSPPPGPAVGPPPATDPGPDRPLPPCKRTIPIATSDALAAGVSAAQPGDCLVLADGNYTFPAITRTASEAEPIVIRAANRGKAVVASGAILLLRSAYLVVEGLDITTAGAPTDLYNAGSNGMIVSFMDSHHCRLSRNRIHPANPVAERDWVVVVGGDSHHNRIDHNDLGPVNANANMLEIDGTGREDPPMAGNVSPYNQIDHNHFHDVNNTGGNNWESLRIGRSWQGPSKGFNVIEHNLLTRATGDPETISLKSSDNIVRYNTMRSTNGEICSRHGNRNRIYGNYILEGSRGMRIYGADHRIYNNYVAAASTGIWLESGASSATDEPGKEHYQVYRAWVFNNTVIGQPIRVGGSKQFQPVDCRVANNIVVGSTINPDGTKLVSEGNIAGGMNPLTMQDGIFRLLPNAAGAAAIGRAVNSDFYMITDDIDGQPRTSPDVGADQHSDQPPSIKGPLTAADVGPDAD